MVHALRSRHVVTPEGERDAVVVIDGERIVEVVGPDDVGPGIPVEDLGEVALLPGLVDVHTHLNEPGRTEWEGFWTGTRAAAAGGFTTVVDMPLNCLPETTNVSALREKREAARGQAWVDYALWGGAVNGNQGDLQGLADAGVPGFKCFLIYPGCDGFTEIDAANLELAVPHVARLGRPLLVHAELAAPIDAAFARLEREGADWRRYATYLASRPDEAELQAIAMLLELCRKYRFRLHIVHLSTAQALPMLAAAKREGLPVSVETCPHYLHFTAEGIPDGGTMFKCAPPIRSAANREALWGGLVDGTIDMIATDHSPCPPHMKRMESAGIGSEMGRFDEAWGGIASLSTALLAVWTECVERGLGLERLVRWMSGAPAWLAGIDDRVGAIAAGRHANLLAFDTKKGTLIAPEGLFQRHLVSPYTGETLRGRVCSVWVRGERVFHEGSFSGEPIGREMPHADAPVLHDWNRLTPDGAFAQLLPCNGSTAWTRALVAARPIPTTRDLLTLADEVWGGLPETDWGEAFDSHPRIGEREAKAASAQSLRWSEGEQSGVGEDEAVQAALSEGNRTYEERFRRIFLVCAMGKSASEILAILGARLGNDPDAELAEAAEQQRRITQLRLRKWLGMAPARCEDV